MTTGRIVGPIIITLPDRREVVFTPVPSPARRTDWLGLVIWFALGILTAVALTGCNLAAIVGPQRRLVSVCLEPVTMVLTINGQSEGFQVGCRRWGWTPKVDTLP